MTPRALACLLLVPCGLLGQLRLFLLDGKTERLMAEACDLGVVDTGDRREAVFRARNGGPTPARVETIQVRGTGFALAASLQLPKSLEANAALDFTVRFEPQAAGNYSANLSLNTQTVLLTATALPAPVVSLERDGQRYVLRSPSTTDFGALEQGMTATRRFWVENQTSARLEVTVTVTGASFRAGEGFRSPVALAPLQAAAFEVIFEALQPSRAVGTLEVNRRSFWLQGFGQEPPFPAPVVIVDPPDTTSGRNVRVTVRLASPAPKACEGVVGIDFRSALPDDPAIALLLDGFTRWTTIQVLRGEDIVRFGSEAEVWLQTGTTTGRIGITARICGQVDWVGLNIEPMPVVIDALKATRTSGNLEVNLTGFDNTRTASQAAFSFFDQAGQLLPPGRIQLGVASEFRRYFELSPGGGTFALRAGFPVTGDASVVSFAEVEITNSAGVTRSERVNVRP